MKKVLVSLTVVAALAMTSCGGGDMCACITDMQELGKKMNEAEGDAKEEIAKEFEAKAKECEELGKSMQEGKSEEELEAMGKELAESCDALKDMPH